MSKISTDIDQSKRLAEILPIESADMCYIKHSSSYNPNWEFNEDFPPMILGDVPINKMTVEVLPCWSLTALLDVLPIKLQIVLAINDFQSDKKGKYAIGSADNDEYDCYADNPIDACCDMIIKLKELNLL